MTPPVSSDPRRDLPTWCSLRPSVRRTAIVLACLALAGCACPSDPDANKPGYKAENVFSFWGRLSSDIKRVAVLPLACDSRRGELLDGCSLLQPILVTELTKSQRFEVVPAGPELLLNRTGSDSWTAADVLPADFLAQLRSAYGCDAVLFCQLTEFRSYPPLAVGWRMRLVDVRTRMTVWAVDEVFDDGNTAVARGAAQYQKAHQAP